MGKHSLTVRACCVKRNCCECKNREVTATIYSLAIHFSTQFSPEENVLILSFFLQNLSCDIVIVAWLLSTGFGYKTISHV
jgi:hypothetical protein